MFSKQHYSKPFWCSALKTNRKQTSSVSFVAYEKYFQRSSCSEKIVIKHLRSEENNDRITIVPHHTR